jgi:hypothetical protein
MIYNASRGTLRVEMELLGAVAIVEGASFLAE